MPKKKKEGTNFSLGEIVSPITLAVSIILSAATFSALIVGNFEIALADLPAQIYEAYCVTRDRIFDLLYYLLFSWTWFPDFRFIDLIEDIISTYFLLGLCWDRAPSMRSFPLIRWINPPKEHKEEAGRWVFQQVDQAEMKLPTANWVLELVEISIVIGNIFFWPLSVSKTIREIFRQNPDIGIKMDGVDIDNAPIDIVKHLRRNYIANFLGFLLSIIIVTSITALFFYWNYLELVGVSL